MLVKRMCGTVGGEEGRVRKKWAGLHKIEIGLGTKFQYQFSA